MDEQQIVVDILSANGGTMEHSALVDALRSAGHYDLPKRLVNMLNIPRRVVVTEDSPRPVLMYSLAEAR